MSLIISKEDIENFEQLPSHKAIVQRVQIRIKQAQDFDLPRAIPKELISDIVTNLNSVDDKWVNLINYVRPVLVYYAYARFLRFHDVQVSSFGTEKANSSYSQKLETKEKYQIIKDMESIAGAYTDDLIEFLEENEKDYENYKSNCEKKPIKKGFSIKPIG